MEAYTTPYVNEVVEGPTSPRRYGGAAWAGATSEVASFQGIDRAPISERPRPRGSSRGDGLVALVVEAQSCRVIRTNSWPAATGLVPDTGPGAGGEGPGGRPRLGHRYSSAGTMSPDRRETPSRSDRRRRWYSKEGASTVQSRRLPDPSVPWIAHALNSSTLATTLRRRNLGPSHSRVGPARYRNYGRMALRDGPFDDAKSRVTPALFSNRSSGGWRAQHIWRRAPAGYVAPR